MRRALSCSVLGLVLAGCGGDAKKAPTPSPAAPAKAEVGESRVPAPSAEPAADAPPVRRDGTILAESVLMGTRVTVNLWLDPGREAADAGKAIQKAFDEMARLENSVMSEWQAQSAVSQVNDAAGGEPVTVPRELIEVLSRSQEVSAKTRGSFDVTFHGVGALWKFDPGSRPPSKAEVAERLPLVDYTKIEIDPSATTVKLAAPGMKIGLGAVAKGYIVDAASAVLVREGFANHIVEGGGDTFVSGTKGDAGWVVGVQDPKKQGAIGRIPARDEAVVTSGNYERYFDFEGKRYAHIIDPRTGWPLPYETSPRSITVVAKTATDADAYATALTVMGSEEAARFVETIEGVDAVIIAADGTVTVSSGLQDRYETIRPADGP